MLEQCAFSMWAEAQPPVPGIAQSRARREQIDDLVLAEDIFFEALCDRQDAARAATFVGASAARRFRAENPRAHCHCAPAWIPKMASWSPVVTSGETAPGDGKW